MDARQRLVELEQKYDNCLNDITELQFKLEQEESKLFKCQEEIRHIQKNIVTLV